MLFWICDNTNKYNAIVKLETYELITNVVEDHYTAVHFKVAREYDSSHQHIRIPTLLTSKFFKLYPTEMRERAVASPDAVVDATGAAVQAHPALAADFVMTRIGVALLPLKLVSLFVSRTNVPMLPTPSESNLLGAGAYSKVYRTRFKGAEAAAKVFSTYTGRGGCLQEVIGAVANSP